jgi:hypothetical protein
VTMSAVMTDASHNSRITVSVKVMSTSRAVRRSVARRGVFRSTTARHTVLDTCSDRYPEMTALATSIVARVFASENIACSHFRSPSQTATVYIECYPVA